MCRNPLRCILPPGVLHNVVRDADDAGLRNAALATLELDHRFRLTRAEAAARRGGQGAQPVTCARVGGRAQRTIYDQEHSEDQTPGRVVRAEAQEPVSDEA